MKTKPNGKDTRNRPQIKAMKKGGGFICGCQCLASEHANKTQIDDKIITNLCKYLPGKGGLK